MKLIALLVLLASLISCIRKEETDSPNAQLHTGEIERLVNDRDTLVLSVYLSGCIQWRTDFIKFYRVSDSVYIQPEIYLDGDVRKGERIRARNYSALKNDTLNFDHLLRNAQETLTDALDSAERKSVFISLGVLHKWSKKYYYDKMSEEHSVVYRMYFEIMHQYYPEIELFDPIGITIIEEDLLME